ncbi:MAG: hypothetical protein Q8P15_03030 [Nanoarchaeota archaeon]|nr:hypothetical protein [Nanoarchaeota archaeon]
MIIKVKIDKQKSESLFEMANLREEYISHLDLDKFSPLVAEDYYEIIKELASALILLDGFKSIGENSHKDLIDFLEKYKFSDGEIVFLHDLRIKRNKSSYEGKRIDYSYLKEKKGKIEEIIKKLKTLIKNKQK